jgi:hypothetical protein
LATLEGHWKECLVIYSQFAPQFLVDQAELSSVPWLNRLASPELDTTWRAIRKHEARICKRSSVDDKEVEAGMNNVAEFICELCVAAGTSQESGIVSQSVSLGIRGRSEFVSGNRRKNLIAQAVKHANGLVDALDGLEIPGFLPSLLKNEENMDFLFDVDRVFALNMEKKLGILALMLNGGRVTSEEGGEELIIKDGPEWRVADWAAMIQETTATDAETTPAKMLYLQTLLKVVCSEERLLEVCGPETVRRGGVKGSFHVYLIRKLSAYFKNRYGLELHERVAKIIGSVLEREDINRDKVRAVLR